MIGVELVECLVHHGVEVDFLIREPWYWPMALSRDEGRFIEEHIRHQGVNLRLEEEVVEVAAGANGRVASVRTSKGNDIPCQMLGICIGVRPQIEWLRQVRTPPALGRGVQVASSFLTSLPDVWAAGDCAEFPDNPKGVGRINFGWRSAIRQGQLAGENMAGGNRRFGGNPEDYFWALFGFPLMDRARK